MSKRPGKGASVQARHRVWVPEHVRADGRRVAGHYKRAVGEKKRPKRPKVAPPKGKRKKLATETVTKKHPPKRKPKKTRVVALPQEILYQRLLEFRRRLRRQKKIRPPRGHRFGDAWVSRVNGALVYSRNIVVAMIVNEENLEEIVHRVMEGVRSIYFLHGTLYASLYLFEYGREIVGSPGEMFFEDEEGFMWESFRGVAGSNSLREFEFRLRSELEMQVTHEKSAVWFEHATVRSAVIDDEG